MPFQKLIKHPPTPQGTPVEFEIVHKEYAKNGFAKLYKIKIRCRGREYHVTWWGDHVEFAESVPLEVLFCLATNLKYLGKD